MTKENSLLDELKNMEVESEPRDFGIADISPEQFTVMFSRFMAEIEPDFPKRSIEIMGVDVDKENLRVFFQVLSEKGTEEKKKGMN